MPTETVDIRFRESGARVIKRRIDEMGQAANNATRGIFLMQRALFVLGGAGALLGLVRQIDLLTNYENRLKLTTSSTENLNAVSKELFETARKSRSSFESVAEIYTRTALSVKSLGISQKEVIRFTESLSKSTIISGASAREAHAAMIQLGQGMASNTLRGDELRSVLEQLPFVADVIAKHFKVTRGELRVLGEEGKISAKDILEAFKNAEVEIDALFANTTPTIEQALTVANVNWLQFLDTVDDTTGISADVASAIIYLSKNIDILVGSVATLAAAWAFTFSAKLIQRVFAWIAGLREGAVFYARIIEVENLRAASSVRMATATQAANAANAQQIAIGIAQLQQNKVILTQQRLEEAFIIRNGRARNALTGQFVSLTAAKANLNRTTIALIANERVLTASGAALAASNAAQAGAANTLAAANTRLAASQAASATFGAKLARTFPLMAGGIALVMRGLIALWALFSAHPIGALITLLGLAVVALVKFGNQIKLTEDDVVGLNDYIVASFQLTVEAMQPLMDDFVEIIQDGLEKATEFFALFKFDVSKVLFELAKIIWNFFALIPRIATGVVFALIRAWEVLPDHLTQTMADIVNVFSDGFEDIANNAIDHINEMIKKINSLIELLGADKAAQIFGLSGKIPELAPIELPRVIGEPGDLGKDIGNALMEGFKEGFDATSLENVIKKTLEILTPFHEEIIKRAREIADARKEAELDPGGGGAGGGIDPKFQKLLDAMNKQINLLKLSGEARRIETEIIKMEKSLKRDLTDIEEKLATVTIKRLLAAKDEAKVLNEIIGPREIAARNLAALNSLYANGRIEIEDYTAALKKMTEAADEASGTFMGSFKAAMSSAILDSQQLGEALGRTLVDAAGSASDAIVKFAQTGKINIREFFAELFAQLMKLLTQQLLLRMLMSFFPGGAAVNTAMNIAGPNGHDGGSIMPSGTGSTDTQPVFFNKRPDERVDILTPDQQTRQRKALSGGDRETQTPSQDVTIINVDDPNKVLDALSTTRGQRVLMNTMERNAAAFRKALSI